MLAINGSKTDFMIAFWNDERFVLLLQRCEKIDSYTKSGFTLGRDIKYTFELEKNILNIIPKESIIFRAVKRAGLSKTESCSECDSFQLYQFAEVLP